MILIPKYIAKKLKGLRTFEGFLLGLNAGIIQEWLYIYALLTRESKTP
jgi:hypothetical protein